jgi:hypothetical protein
MIVADYNPFLRTVIRGAFMVKIVFLLKGERNVPADAFRKKVLEAFIPEILAGTKTPCKATLTTVDPPRLSITPFRKDRIALISIWEKKAAKEQEWAKRACRSWEGPCHGYRVEESTPRSYERTWPAGTQTPGLGLLTLFRARGGIGQDDFIRMWHQGHTPLGMRVHPLWNYIRNVVTAPLVAQSPDLGGIVEEHVRCPEDLLNPVRFFGGIAGMLPNMVRIGLDIRKWMDLGSIENYLVTEHWIRDDTGHGAPAHRSPGCDVWNNAGLPE